ncbi:GntR family transcriptional regulator [Azospirillum sp. A39]|uniref:GntR family transcriptional regulator n=1 Tax=Azospirillum sp. A39 TaxID=3462279 RepID=UPI004045D38B
MSIVRVAAPLRQQVIDLLRAAIGDGRYSPGERLVERELCEALQVSRPILREALRQLEAEGLVRNVPQRGLEVVTLSAEDVRQIYQVRGALESLAAAEFVTHASEAQWRELADAMDAFEAAADEGVPSRIQAAKTTFYDVLIAGCGNPTMAQILKAMHNRIQLLRGVSLAEPGRLPNTIREIRAIYEALCARDAVRTRQAYDEHIANAARVTMLSLAKAAPPHGRRRAP